MKLREYIDQYPSGQRLATRKRIAEACGVSEPCIRHYANGTRQVPAKHFDAICKACEGYVALADLLPVTDAA